MLKNLTSLLVFSLLSTTTAQALSAQIPMRDFFKNPEQTKFQISYNAKYIAFLKPWNNRLNIFVQPLSPDRLPVGDAKQVTFAKERDVVNFEWKGDSKILYTQDSNGDENDQIFALDLETQKILNLTPLAGSKSFIFNALPYIHPTEILVASNMRDKSVFDIYRINIENGTKQMVARNNGKIMHWATDHNGIVRVAQENDGLTSKILTRNSEQEEFKTILEYEYKNSVIPLAFTADNKLLYASSNINRDKAAIVLIDPSTGKEVKTIFAHPEVDVNECRFSNKRKVFTAAVYHTWRQQYHFMDPNEESAQRIAKIKEKLGDVQINTISSNLNEDLYTYSIADDKGWAVYLYDQRNDRLTSLYDSDRYLPRKLLADKRPIKYQARDGLTIHGYLTLPRNSNGKNLPLVVNPHGGPYNIRNLLYFEPMVQFLANRGYAVLQVNFRGSAGYGKKFYEAAFRQWGRAMQDDITDGVKYLIDQGVADPKRVAIYGASYGGYAALAGATFTPDLYACAIDVVGPSNIFTLFDTMATYWAPVKKIWIDRIGDPVKDKDMLTAISPVFHVDKIKAPLFVAQGAKDPRVNVNESNQIVDALRKRGIEVEYMLKENEGHGFANEENRFELNEAIEKFLAKHLKNAPEPEARVANSISMSR